MGAASHESHPSPGSRPAGPRKPTSRYFKHGSQIPVVEFLDNLWGLGIGLSYRPARL